MEKKHNRFNEQKKKKLSPSLDINNTNINLEYHFSKNIFISYSFRDREEFFNDF